MLAVVECEVQQFVVVGAGLERRFDFAVVQGEFSSGRVSLKKNTQ
jgi:hypothetical protein